MVSALHRHRLLAGLVAALLVTAGIPGAAVSGSTSGATTPDSDEVTLHDLRTWVAPKSADLSNLSAIRTAKASENLTRSSVVAKNDTLVFELRGSGLEGAVTAQNGSNVTTRFFEVFENESASFVVRGTAPGTSQERAYLDVLDPSAATVVADARNDSYYLVVALEDVSVTDGRGGVPANNQDQLGVYRANATLANASALADGNESVIADFEVEFRDADLDTPKGTDRVFVAPAPNQIVTGATTLAPGSRLTVRIHDDVGNEVVSQSVRVENGTRSRNRFVATLDFSAFSNWSAFVVTVSGPDGTTLIGSNTGQEEMRGWVVVPTASVNLSDRSLTESGITVESATLSHGGYVAIHRGSPDGEVLGRSEQIGPDERYGRFVGVESQLESNTTLVAVAHRNGPGDTLGEPYTENGTVVADSARYTTTPETTRTTTETTTRTTETTTHATDTTGSPMHKGTTTGTTHTTPDGTTGTGGESIVPGFDVLPALAALLALVLGLLARRQ